jgi:hypothetical protein
MTQRDRDRLVVLKKVQKKLIRQAQAASERGVTVRHVNAFNVEPCCEQVVHKTRQSTRAKATGRIKYEHPTCWVFLSSL